MGCQYRHQLRQRKTATEAHTSFFVSTEKNVDLSNGKKIKFFEEAQQKLHHNNNNMLMQRVTTDLHFAQMSAKKGIQMYGKEAQRKLIAEFAQLLDNN